MPCEQQPALQGSYTVEEERSLMKNEIEEVKQIWILLVQQRNRLKPHYEQTQKQLNFQVNPFGVIK